MDIKNLEIGDILLFSAEKGSFISWAITFLTDAPVSHAAMFYNEQNQSIIEESPPQVAVNPATDRFKDREIYVRRLSVEEGLPLSPVIEEATNYLNKAEPYDMSGLYMVGLLLIYRKFTPNTIVQKAMIKILKKLAASIIKYIHEHKNPGKLPMVCSQFVAQCYNNAGDKYKLKIESGVLQKVSAIQDNSRNVLDQVLQILQSPKKTNLQTLSSTTMKIMNEPPSSGEELCKELKEAFDATANETDKDITSELIESISQFSQAHYLLSSGDVQLQNVLLDDVTTTLQFLKGNENMFVSPGDLLKHCVNLKDVGTIK